jgi:hypothetical protein
MTSGSKYFIDQPPCRNPPLVSSSGPPGAGHCRQQISPFAACLLDVVQA